MKKEKKFGRISTSVSLPHWLYEEVNRICKERALSFSRVAQSLFIDWAEGNGMYKPMDAGQDTDNGKSST